MNDREREPWAIRLSAKRRLAIVVAVGIAVYSDVSVTTVQMRRTTLAHSVLSFVFNIAVLAMSINVIGGAFRQPEPISD